MLMLRHTLTRVLLLMLSGSPSRLARPFHVLDRLIFGQLRKEVVDFLAFCAYKMVLLPGVGFYPSGFGSSASDRRQILYKLKVFLSKKGNRDQKV
jgi:hypothetical protein